MLSNSEKYNINTQIPFLSANSDVELDNQYSLKIVIESILWLKDLTNNDISISFCNPIYQKFYTIPNSLNLKVNELTYFENIQCRMDLEIPSSQVLDIFSNWSPTIIFCNKDNTVLTECRLNLNAFKLNKSKEQKFVTRSLYAQNNDSKKIADINIILTVYDNKIKVSTQQNANLGLPIFFQISEQLENWKEKQKQIFKKLEKERLSLVLEEWQKEKAKLQEKLLKNIQDTNNALQEIKQERDLLKAAIEKELNKRNVDCTHMDSSRSNNKKNIKTTGKTNIKQTKTTQEKKELDELKKKIKKQTLEINSLKEQQCSAAEFANLIQTVDTLKAKNLMKDAEMEYLKQQWAKTTRRLNSYRNHYRFLKAQRETPAPGDNMISLMIQQLLDMDAEHKIDLEELHSIRQELDSARKSDYMSSSRRDEEKSEIDLLLQTRTYNTNDKLIQMLNRKKQL